MLDQTFINRRVKITVRDATLLRRGEEKRHHFRVSINLSEDGVLTGMPEWIQDWYTLVQKSGTHADDLKSKRLVLENMSLGFWPTEKSRSKFFSQVNGAMLSKFVMQRDGKGDEADVRLYFSMHFPGRQEIHVWTYDHKTADCWVDFEQMQGDLDLEAATEDDTEDEE